MRLGSDSASWQPNAFRSDAAVTVLMGSVARAGASFGEPITSQGLAPRFRRRCSVRLLIRVMNLLITGVVILRACSRLPVSAASATAFPSHASEASAAATAPRTAAEPPAPPPPGWRIVVGDQAHASVALRTVNTGGAAVILLRFDVQSTRLVLHPVDGDPGSRKRMRAVISAA